MTALRLAFFLGIAGCAATSAFAFDDGEVLPQDLEPKPVYSPYAGRAYPDRVLFGDLHFHTNLSFDAGLLGTSLTPERRLPLRARRKGDLEQRPAGSAHPPARLPGHHRPRGADGPGAVAADLRPAAAGRSLGPAHLRSVQHRRGGPHAGLRRDPRDRHGPGGQPVQFTGPGEVDLERRHHDCRRVQPARHLHHLHRLRMDLHARRATTCTAWCSSPTARRRRARSCPSRSSTARRPNCSGTTSRCTRSGPADVPSRCRTTATSVNGLMFTDRQFDGTPMTADYAARRIRWEPIHEMSQMKGDEETHPLLSPDDEFADYERWDVGNISGSAAEGAGNAAGRVRARGAAARPQDRPPARGQSLQARHERLDGHPHRALDLARGELLRQDGVHRALGGPLLP